MSESAYPVHAYGFFDFVQSGLPATSVSRALTTVLGQAFTVQAFNLSDSETEFPHTAGKNSIILVAAGRAQAQLHSPGHVGRFAFLASGDAIRLGDADQTSATVSTAGLDLRLVKIDFPSQANGPFQSKLVLINSLPNEFVHDGVTEVTTKEMQDFRRVVLREDNVECSVPLRITTVLLNPQSTAPHSHPGPTNGGELGYQLYVFLDDSRHDVHLNRHHTGRNPEALTFQVYREARRGTGQTHVAKPGDLLLIPHGIVHQVFGGLVAVVDFCTNPRAKQTTEFIKLRS